MIKVFKTELFEKRFINLKDHKAKTNILARLKLLEAKNHKGDYRHIEGKIFELKINLGPGYRIYFLEQNPNKILLLGGTKKRQQKDINKSIKLAKEIEQELKELK